MRAVVWRARDEAGVVGASERFQRAAVIQMDHDGGFASPNTATHFRVGDVVPRAVGAVHDERHVRAGLVSQAHHVAVGVLAGF